MCMRSNSIDTDNGDLSETSDVNNFDDDYDAIEDEDDEDLDDLDDELLSASPQIPANLLKLVEQEQ